MSTVKNFIFGVLVVTIFGLLPKDTVAMKPCEMLWSPGKVYNQATMKRCDLVFKKMTYDAIASFPSTWR